MTEKELKKKERKEKIKNFLSKYWHYIAIGVVFGFILGNKDNQIESLKRQLQKAGKKIPDDFDALEMDLADLMVDIKDSIESDAKFAWFERSYKNEIIKKRKLLEVTIKEKGW